MNVSPAFYLFYYLVEYWFVELNGISWIGVNCSYMTPYMLVLPTRLASVLALDLKG